METRSTSFYERLGGIYNIATVVDDFIDRIMVDDRLNANPRVDEAHHRVLPPGFKYLVTGQVGEAAGGGAAVLGSFTGRFPSAPPDHRAGVGGLRQRLQPVARQIWGTAAGTVRVARDHREHPRRDCCWTDVLIERRFADWGWTARDTMPRPLTWAGKHPYRCRVTQTQPFGRA
jgi:hypothetical protein